MKYILLLLLLGWMSVKGQAINSQVHKPTETYCPAHADHKHQFTNLDKCNNYGCGAACDCGARKYYKSGLVVLNRRGTSYKDNMMEYKRDSTAYVHRKK